MAENEKLSSFKLDSLIDIYKKYINEYKNNERDNLEFEIRFGTAQSYRVNQTMFTNTYTYLTNMGFIVENSNYMLKTTMEYDNDDGNKRESNIRIEINDINDIKTLCETSSLPHPKSMNYTQKLSVDKRMNRPIYNNDYGYRVSLQKERSLSSNSSAVRNILSEWGNQKKLFRYMHRTSLIHKDIPCIRVDLSSVKGNYRNKQIMFQDTNLFNEPFGYEIEIEAINEMIGDSFDFVKFSKDLKKTIKYVLCGIQNTFSIPIKVKEREDVIGEYFDILERFNHGEQVKRIEKSFNFMGPSSYTLQKNNIVKGEQNNSVTIYDGFCVTDKADGERKLLYINKKGKLYFIDNNLRIQYTGSNTPNKRLFNAIIDGEHIMKDKYGNNINLYAAFDIYIGNDKDKNPQDYRGIPFYLFDYEKQEINKEELLTRYEILSSFVHTLTNTDNDKKKLQHLIPNNKINIVVKDFVFENMKANITINQCCETLLNKIATNNYRYNTDGIIFTSKYLGVTQEKEGDVIKNKKYTWGHSFKWKPPQYNTIDFLIEVQKDNVGNIMKKSKLINGDIREYYEIHLKVGFDENHREHGYFNGQKRILNLEYENMTGKDYTINSKYHAEKFRPTNPSNENAYICHIPVVNNNGTINMITEEKDIMLDDTIVEFRYEKNSEDVFMSWVPLRVRYDKTHEYKLFNSNFGNAYHVANSNWQSIHNPVTEKMLKGETKLNEDTILNKDDDVYYNGNKGQSETIPLRNFHNLYIKNKLISIVSSKSSRTTLLDLAVGKGGDLPKWIRNNIFALLGIDISKDNIHNRTNGACARYLSEYKRNKKMPIAMFIEGNSGKIMENGSFAEDVEDELNNNSNISLFDDEGEIKEEVKVKRGNNISQMTLKSLMGVGNKEDQSIKFLKKNFGLFKDKFDITSIQFALHYMFKNAETLHSFLKNIADYTKIGGHFIGTCYNGNRVYEELEKINQGEKMEKFKGNKKIWHVVKGYSDAENEFLNNDEKCLGYTISVFQESINKEFDEYLVNFNYFIKMMEQYGFVVEENQKIKGVEIPSIGSFNELYDIMIKEKNTKNYGEASNMSDEEKFVSYLNNYFIFKKQYSVNTDTLYNYYVNNGNDDGMKTNFEISKAKITTMNIVLE